ncbi:MAG: hypothetical protein K6F82_06750 [Sphaerochaetaceae bacterium]|nr:hypothetical protein [Sphaerochaetaceae bacterium]
MRFKALIRKELLEAFRSFFWDQKTGKRRKPSSLLLFAVLYAVIFYMLINMYSPIFGAASSAWLPTYTGEYFVYAIIISSVMSIFLSLIIIYSSLFMSKDNSVMLSLPVRPYEILLSRLFSVYLYNIVFTALSLIPAFVHFALNARLTVMSTVTFLMTLIILPALQLSISTLAGYLVGLATARMRHKQGGVMILTVIGTMSMSFAFGQLSGSSMAGLMEGSAPTSIIRIMEGPVNPLGLAGRAFSGSVISLLLFLLLSAVFITAVTVLVGRSVVRILGITEKQKKVAFRQTMIRSNSVKQALFRRERQKVMSNALYVLNCMLGSFMALIGAVVLIIFSSTIKGALGDFSLPVSIIGGILCALSSMNDITAPSVSTEGKSLWVLNTLPVRSIDILATKVKFHFIFTFVPMLLLLVSMCFVFRVSPVSALASLAVMALFILDVACLGLFNDLKHGNTSYISEAVAIKQSMSVLFSLLEAIALAAIILVPSILLFGAINAWIVTGAQIILLSVLLVLLSSWMRKTGCRLLLEI